jgi:hypothetical protein
VSPAVNCSISTASDLSTEAEVGAVVLEAIVGLAADLVRATEEVGGAGAPVTSVEGAELVTGKSGAAGGVADGPAVVCDRDVDISAAADSFMHSVRSAAGVARARVLASSALASVDTAVLAVVIAADSSHVAAVAFFRSPHPLVVVRAAGSTSLLGLELGDCAETRANGHADGTSMSPAVSCEQCRVSTTSDLSAEAEVAIVAEETGVGLAADLVRATGEVVGSGAPVASVEGTELVAAEA